MKKEKINYNKNNKISEVGRFKKKNNLTFGRTSYVVRFVIDKHRRIRSGLRQNGEKENKLKGYKRSAKLFFSPPSLLSIQKSSNIYYVLLLL